MFKSIDLYSGLSACQPYAHRGLALDCPENTVAAFAAAAAQGVQWIETDVRASVDGKVLVFHDASLGRVAGLPGKLSQLTWDEIKDISLPGGHKIPLLADVLEEFPDLYFNIDIKDWGSAQQAAEVIAQAGAAQRVRIASFSDRRRTYVLKRLRELLPDQQVRTSASEPSIYVFFLLAYTFPSLWPFARRVLGHWVEPFEAIQVPHYLELGALRVPVLTRRLLAVCHRFGYQVQVWTVDDSEQMRQLLAQGVDGIVSNRVDILGKILKEDREL